jgi:hypothetical protein
MDKYFDFPLKTVAQATGAVAAFIVIALVLKKTGVAGKIGI